MPNPDYVTVWKIQKQKEEKREKAAMVPLRLSNLESQRKQNLQPEVHHNIFVLSRFSRVRLYATPRTIHSLPGSSVHGIFQARILA